MNMAGAQQATVRAWKRLNTKVHHSTDKQQNTTCHTNEHSDLGQDLQGWQHVIFTCLCANGNALLPDHMTVPAT